MIHKLCKIYSDGTLFVLMKFPGMLIGTRNTQLNVKKMSTLINRRMDTGLRCTQVVIKG